MRRFFSWKKKNKIYQFRDNSVYVYEYSDHYILDRSDCYDYSSSDSDEYEYSNGRLKLKYDIDIGDEFSYHHFQFSSDDKIAFATCANEILLVDILDRSEKTIKPAKPLDWSNNDAFKEKKIEYIYFTSDGSHLIIIYRDISMLCLNITTYNTMWTLSHVVFGSNQHLFTDKRFYFFANCNENTLIVTTLDGMMFVVEMLTGTVTYQLNIGYFTVTFADSKSVYMISTNLTCIEKRSFTTLPKIDWSFETNQICDVKINHHGLVAILQKNGSITILNNEGEIIKVIERLCQEYRDLYSTTPWMENYYSDKLARHPEVMQFNTNGTKIEVIYDDYTFQEYIIYPKAYSQSLSVLSTVDLSKIVFRSDEIVRHLFDHVFFNLLKQK